MKLSQAQRTLVGYARVSSVGQSLDVQLGKLQDCHKVFQEKKSGASDQRPALRSCLEYVRRGLLFKTKKAGLWLVQGERVPLSRGSGHICIDRIKGAASLRRASG